MLCDTCGMSDQHPHQLIFAKSISHLLVQANTVENTREKSHCKNFKDSSLNTERLMWMNSQKR